MVLNTGKCRYICMGKKDVDENETFQISSQQKMINSKEVEILGINYHFTNISKTFQRKQTKN